VIHRLSWLAVGRAMWAGLRAIAGPTLPLPVTGDPYQSDAERMATEIDEFVRNLDAGLIDASDFER
jgi:hypothetical protein